LSDIEAAWAREIDARVAAYERGDTTTHSAVNVFAEARRLTK
jgi:hypothetical protein